MHCVHKLRAYEATEYMCKHLACKHFFASCRDLNYQLSRSFRFFLQRLHCNSKITQNRRTEKRVGVTIGFSSNFYLVLSSRLPSDPVFPEFLPLPIKE